MQNKFKQELRIFLENPNDVLTALERRAILYHIYESRSLSECARMLHTKKQGISDAVKRATIKLKHYFKTVI